ASGENHWRFLFRRTKVRGPMPYSPMTVVLASFCNARSETSRCSGLPHERATPRRTTYCASFGCQVTQIPGTFSMKNPSPAPLLHGRPERAGTVRRVPAAEVEALVGSAVREHLEDCKENTDRDLIRNRVVRVEVQANQLVVELKAAGSSGPPTAVDNE